MFTLSFLERIKSTFRYGQQLDVSILCADRTGACLINLLWQILSQIGPVDTTLQYGKRVENNLVVTSTNCMLVLSAGQ